VLGSSGSGTVTNEVEKATCSLEVAAWVRPAVVLAMSLTGRREREADTERVERRDPLTSPSSQRWKAP
jgi:hypothetical protein